MYGDILSIFNTICELYKQNPEDPKIFKYVKENKFTLDDIKNHVYKVYEDYLADSGFSNKKKSPRKAKSTQRSRKK